MDFRAPPPKAHCFYLEAPADVTIDELITGIEAIVGHRGLKTLQHQGGMKFCIHGLHLTSRPLPPLRRRHAGAPLAPSLLCARELKCCPLRLGCPRSLRAMPPVHSKPAFHEAYYARLIRSARARYEERVKLCDDVHPYTLQPGADTTTDISAFPEVTHEDIVNYLVFSASFATLEEMKAYKSLEAHNYFTSGWVKALSAKRLQGEKVLLLGEVSWRPCF